MRKNTHKSNDDAEITMQGTRKLEGTKIERTIVQKLRKIFPKLIFTLNTHEGIDIYVKDGNIYNLEVKSCKEYEITKDRHKNQRLRKGRFLLKREDWLNSDLFIFVIKKVDNDNNWNKEIEIIYIDSNDIRKYIKARNLYKSANFKLSIQQLDNFTKVDIKKFLK